ncbi:succinate dehydrogenase cytochrome b subunit [Pontiellaceae bacterium B12219]|nr:succinate dehydrogenase cytochrome b subunit [Pontiellaceae bacterium B12219]
MSIKTSILSSIGQKLLLATSGLIMFLMFLIPHMGGNILFLFGPELFNSYAHHLHKLVPIVIGIEVLMLISITVHMIIGIRVALANKKAASTRHSQKSSAKRSFAARMMPVSGLMIFIFIIKHLLDFTFTQKNQVYIHDEIGYDVYEMVLYRFQDPVHVAFYILFMIAVGFHLSHALQSALQTYGIYVPREGSKIKIASAVIATLMAATFAIIPITAFIR